MLAIPDLAVQQRLGKVCFNPPIRGATSMPKVSEIFGGAHFKAEHLNGRPRVVLIDGYDTEMIYGKEEYVLYLADEKRGLRLSNNTIAHDIAQVLGDDIEKWPGHRIELYPEQRTITDRDTQTEKSITMIRARAPATTSTPPPKPAPKQPMTARRSDLDDDIPY
jgi:hypothetical protein